MTQKRVLVIGLDGATFDLINPWVEQGFLPNLGRLMAEGNHAPLASTLQPTTAPAWVTFMTGVNQGKHGLYDFIQRKSESYNLEVTNSSFVSAPSFFEYASKHERRSIAINIPYTFPPQKINGIMVGGPFAPAVTPELVEPTTYFETLKEIVPDYFVLPDFNARAKDSMGDYAQQLMRGIEYREKLSLHMMQSEPWELFTVVFMATDEVQHAFWHCMEAEEGTEDFFYKDTILQIYSRLDEAIGKLIMLAEQLDEDQKLVTIILSDHGAGPFEWMINLNRWLSDEGYLVFRTKENGRLQQWRAQLFKRAASLYRNYMSAKMRTRIRAQLGLNRFTNIKEGFESALLTSNVDWPQTKAYALGAGGNIYINVEGREPNGTVSFNDAYEQIRNEIIGKLSRLTDPETGELVIKKVHKREDIYHGAQLEKAPDLIIEWRDYAYWGRGRYDNQSPLFEKQRKFDFSEQPLTGSHRPEGILIIHGEDVAKCTKSSETSILNLAPTILGLVGIQPPDNMDGRILSEMFQPETFTKLDLVQEIARRKEQINLQSEEESKITEHLRSLGYL